MKTKPIKMSEWLDAIEEMKVCNQDKIPDGWKRFSEIRNEIGRGKSQSRRILEELISRGIAEVKRFRVSNGSAGIRPTPFYRIKK